MSKKKQDLIESLKKKLNSPEAKARAAEWRKKEEERIAKLPPIEQLADKVSKQLIWAGLRLRYDKDETSKIPKGWQRKHNLSVHPAWGYWAEKEDEHALRHYNDLMSKFAFDMPEMLAKSGDMETLKRLNKSLPQDWTKIEDRASVVADIGNPIEFTTSKYTCCSICEEPYHVRFDGKDFVILNECKYPNGIISEVDVPFPSGKIVVQNDARRLFPEADKDRYINVTMACALVALDYAEAGCAHMFVGNSCPGVFQLGKDKLAVGNTGDRRKTLSVDGRRYRQTAWVCTDLWWYSMTDYDEWCARAGTTPEESRGGGWTGEPHVITVKPGLYRFKHLKHTIQAMIDYDTVGDHQDLFTVAWRVGDVGVVKPVYRVYPA